MTAICPQCGHVIEPMTAEEAYAALKRLRGEYEHQRAEIGRLAMLQTQSADLDTLAGSLEQTGFA